MTIVVVTGTGTDVGKTWFAAATLRAAAGMGAGVAARKPAESFTPGDGPTDSEVLSAATGEEAPLVCPPHRRFPVPMAPPMAAAALGLPPFTIADLVGEVSASLPSPPPSGRRLLVLVEGAGGPRSPLADDGDTVDLVDALTPDAVVLVADAGLGAINSVLLCAEALAGRRLVVALNRFDPSDGLHRRNVAWLRDRSGLHVVTDPPALATALLTP